MDRLTRGLSNYEKALELDPSDKECQARVADIKAQISAARRTQAEHQTTAKINDVVFYPTEADTKTKGAHSAGEIFDSIQVWRSR